jgi:hypothetical protein
MRYLSTLGEVPRAGHAAEQAATRSEIAAIHGADQLGAQHGHVLGVARPDVKEERHAIHEAWKSWAARQGMSGSVALVWPDADGLAHRLTDPQQQPFLDAVRLDQIRAQSHANYLP